MEKNIRFFITRYILTIPVKVAENGLIQVGYCYMVMLLDGVIIRIALCIVRLKCDMLFYNKKQKKKSDESHRKKIYDKDYAKEKRKKN